MEIQPDRRLKTKGYYILWTLTGILLLIAIFLHFTVPLIPEVKSDLARNYIWGWSAFTIVLMWLLSLPIMLLWIRNLRYFIEEDRITIHKGIITKIQQNIPYRAITDFQLQRTLYDRILGIGALRIQTAGQSQAATGYEGKLSGLTDWQNLLDDLRVRVKAYHRSKQAPGDQGPAPPQNDGIMQEILLELRAIRKKLETS
ncbi:MAG: PH domain-containing protein [Candidatus Marinimicrobia bacterium]|nr:PH domain-containing protein [Candidatus Neomarinimicrobiota bacterium]MCF7839177.1 PH domain-containing protein [Candidatus Neomarinimicrobiota bacterium]